jgi:TRAP-type C4-dicarboxylate transport system permease small subunit
VNESGPTSLQRALGVLQQVNRGLHFLAGGVLLVILVVTVLNIIGRELNRPVAGSIEVTQLFMGLMVFLALGYGESERVHISVDLLYERLGTRGKSVLRIFGRSVGVIVVLLMVWRLWIYAGEQAAGNYQTGIYRWPISPFVRVAAAGALMLAITMVGNIVADLLGVEGFAESDEHEIEQAI